MSGAEAVYMLILMRLKTELNPYDDIRLHKSALLLNIFSKKKCFKINNCLEISYFPEIEVLTKQLEQLADELKCESEDSLSVFYNQQEQRIQESYQRSIPYILHTATFVNSITNNRTLLLVTALIALLDTYPLSTVNEILKLLDDNGYLQEVFTSKIVLTTIVNLERSGVLNQAEGKYSLKYDYRGVTVYQSLFL